MTHLPSLATEDRVTDAVLVVSCGILQAAALGVAAFATRDAFAPLHLGVPLADDTILALAVAGALTALCLCVSGRVAERLGQSYAIDLRHVLYAQIARLPKSRHEERRVGALALRFVGDLSAARLWFGRGLPDVLSACVVLPCAVAILMSLDLSLALAGLVPLAVSLFSMAFAAWHLERRHRRLRRRRANIAISMIERIAIAPELDAIGRTKRELRRLDEQGERLKNDAVARRSRNAGLLSLLQAGTAASGLAILWFAGVAGVTPATVAASLSVLALIALPIQHLGTAWDHYCAWRVAREKVLRLLGEPTVPRTANRTAKPVAIQVVGRIDDHPVVFEAEAGSISVLDGDNRRTLARSIAGLDNREDLVVRFDRSLVRPRIAYIGNQHVGLQGSLRRSVTLMSRKRPSDKRISKVVTAFGLSGILDTGGLDQRLSENGKGLTPAQTLRLDLARAVLGKADVIVIASLRWSFNSEEDNLTETLRSLTNATVVLARQIDTTNPCNNKAI